MWGEARRDARNVPISDPLWHGRLCGVGAANVVRVPGDRLPNVCAFENTSRRCGGVFVFDGLNRIVGTTRVGAERDAWVTFLQLI